MKCTTLWLFTLPDAPGAGCMTMRAGHEQNMQRRLSECQSGVDATRFTCRYVVCRRRAGMAGKCYVEWPVASGSSNSPQGVERRCLWVVGKAEEGGRRDAEERRSYK